MKLKNNKTCVVCGKAYRFCPNCSDKKLQWKISFCTMECKDLYETVTGYVSGDIDKESALTKINKIDLKSKNLTDATINIINRIKGLESD